MEPTSQLTPQQRSTEWFEQRLGKVTASKAGDTMAYYRPTRLQVEAALTWHADNTPDKEWVEYLHKFHPTELCISAGLGIKEAEARRHYRENIVSERLTGMMADPEPYTSYDMKWGMANETIAKNVYQMDYERIITDAPFLQHPELMCGASPDGWVIEPKTGEILACAEIKCLRSANHLYKTIMTQRVPPEHIAQIQMQLWITGLERCVFIAYDSRVPEGLKTFTTEVERDELYLKVLEINVRRFLDECDRDFKHFWAQVKNKPELEGGVVKRQGVEL